MNISEIGILGAQQSTLTKQPEKLAHEVSAVLFELLLKTTKLLPEGAESSAAGINILNSFFTQELAKEMATQYSATLGAQLLNVSSGENHDN